MTPEERRKFRLKQLLMTGKGRKFALASVIGVTGAGSVVGSAGDEARTQPTYDDPVKAAVAQTMVQRLAGSGWDLPNLDHERVDFWVDRFTTDEDMRAKMEGFLARSGQYLPMLSVKLAERDMPHDLIFLAMIESGFQPAAYSTAHASGLWQFIPETGQRYGLRVDGYVDERNHPEKATDAALSYLQDLHDRFGSWYLASAAYNTGENRVGRIMREETGSEMANGEEDYYKIWDRLPRETRDYVPLMIAAGRIAKEPAKYGFEHVIPDEALDHREVTVQAGTTLPEVAGALNLELAILEGMNPHIKRGQAPPDTDYGVKVPATSAERLATNGTLAAAEVEIRGPIGDLVVAP